MKGSYWFNGKGEIYPTGNKTSFNQEGIIIDVYNR